ncbi:conserved phage C-terminal domain-containing protein [Sporosarcina cascadiensis]|uniref:conserved phage C-terminal domain-containing protein n=1 Tax=Sporosarcina cascadiensis TaxID=2660747 RepID=UPI00129A3180|nr:conserved phage C-terminal domain-containing protein [Sporosarcina cascadiensis]
MNLLINESPMIILPSLVKQAGLNEAVLLQQLHFRSLISRKGSNGEKWVSKTYEEWAEEFPFWSVRTIRRIIRNLEEKGYLISTSEHNRMKADNTKWYRIDYSTVSTAFGNQGQCPERPVASVQNVQTELAILDKPLLKKRKNIKKELVGLHHDEITLIISHLNEKTGKQFKANASATVRLLNARLNEGYSVEDIQQVIDLKTDQWLQDEKFRNYLRPSTLFNAKNFENYVNETEPLQEEEEEIQPFVLDFMKGER